MSFHHSQHVAVPDADPDLLTGWQVVSFVDPAGTGGDLAFTQGLASFDLPELLVWARPTEGLDPGADWILTHRERSRLLNRWATELLTNSLQPGMEREERFDGGHSIARFRFRRPALASTLQHPYLPARARVICTPWSLLRRTTDHRAGPLGSAASHRMERWIAAAEATTLGWRLRPGALDHAGLIVPPEPPGSPGLSSPGLSPPALGSPALGSPALGSAEPDQFGPLTRWVEARIAQVLAADSDVVASFLDRLQLAGCARCEDCLLEDLTRVATRLHRNAACREASRVAQDLGLIVAGHPGHSTPLWQRAVATTPTGTGSGCGAEAGLDADSSFRTTLSDGLEILLVSAVLADAVAPSITASATGPWEWAANDHRLPGRLWLAKPTIRRAARDLLIPATPPLVAVAVEHALQSAARPEGLALNRLISGLQTTAAASAPPRALLRRDQVRGLPRSTVENADQLAGQLLTAMAVPYRFPEASWELLRHALRPLVPALPIELRVEIP
ncbi:MAG TPA: hypothetical protein VLL08_12445 [Kineosporiaceae bacterium]|nr:hypothetical protein [Kineosporiaceae bacterium]